MNGEHAHHAVSLVHQREEASPAWRRPVVRGAGEGGGGGSTPGGNTGNGEVGRKGEKVGRGGWGGLQFRMGGGESGFIFTSQTVSQMQPQCARSPVRVRRAAGAEVHRGSGGAFREIPGGGGGVLVDCMHTAASGEQLHKLAVVNERKMN